MKFRLGEPARVLIYDPMMGEVSVDWSNQAKGKVIEAKSEQQEAAARLLIEQGLAEPVEEKGG